MFVEFSIQKQAYQSSFSAAGAAGEEGGFNILMSSISVMSMA